MKKLSFGLLPRVACAIVLGIGLGMVLPQWTVRIFVTFNDLFSQFLGFCIPLIIVGLVVPGISDMGSKAGKMLLVTVAIAYASTVLAGFFSYASCSAVFPSLLGGEAAEAASNPEEALLKPFFALQIPPLFGVMTALVLAFVLGTGIAALKAGRLQGIFAEFRGIIERVISMAIIPLLPLYIFGIFLNMSFSGEAFSIMVVFGKVIGVIFVLHVLLLLGQFVIAGSIAKKNPLKMLAAMMPAYFTALGTSSSAATIPVTLGCAKKMGVKEDVADFCIPLCATIHLSGSVLKITATALAICIMHGLPHDALLFAGFICLLAVMMVAAPGVPGGAIMASVGVLSSVLGFDAGSIALMIALYITIDSFGTACNVTGDGAIAAIVDRIAK